VSTEISGVAYGANKFVAITPSNAYYLYSNDGINWITRYSYETGSIPLLNYVGIGYNSDFGFIIVANGSDTGYYSIDGITWKPYKTYNTQNNNWEGIMVAVGQAAIKNDAFILLTCSFYHPTFCSLVSMPQGSNWTNFTFKENRVWMTQKNLNIVAWSICSNLPIPVPTTPTPLQCDLSYLPPFPTQKPIISGVSYAPTRKLNVMAVAFNYPYPGEQDIKYHLVDSATGVSLRCLKVSNLIVQPESYGGMDFKYRSIVGYQKLPAATANKLKMWTLTYKTNTDAYVQTSGPRLEPVYEIENPFLKGVTAAGLLILVRQGFYIYDSASLPNYVFKWAGYDTGKYYGSPGSFYYTTTGYQPILLGYNTGDPQKFRNIYCITCFSGQSPQTNRELFDHENFGIGSAPEEWKDDPNYGRFYGNDVLYKLVPMNYNRVRFDTNQMIPILPLKISICGQYRKIFYDQETDGLFFTEVNDLYYCKIIRDTSSGIPVNVTTPCFVSTLMIPLGTIYAIGYGDNLYDTI
jgi:hypothetical protein